MDENIIIQMDLEDIIRWVILNREDQKAMDEINSVTFPFSTKYKKFSEAQTSKSKGWQKSKDLDPDNAF